MKSLQKELAEHFSDGLLSELWFLTIVEMVVQSSKHQGPTMPVTLVTSN